MNRLFLLAAALTALMVAPSASANGPADRSALRVVELGEFEGGADFARAQQRLRLALLSPRTRSISRPGKPQLVSFDGKREFLKTSRRLRIWRADVGYTLTVGNDGNVTSCELTEGFRRKYVNDKLCEVLSKHHHFEPAQDALGDASADKKYTARLNYMDIRQELEN